MICRSASDRTSTVATPKPLEIGPPHRLVVEAKKPGKLCLYAVVATRWQCSGFQGPPLAIDATCNNNLVRGKVVSNESVRSDDPHRTAAVAGAPTIRPQQQPLPSSVAASAARLRYPRVVSTPQGPQCERNGAVFCGCGSHARLVPASPRGGTGALCVGCRVTPPQRRGCSGCCVPDTPASPVV